MGKELAAAFHRVRNTFAEADESLGFSISKLCFEGPEDQLRLTANAQPALLTLSVAVYREIEAVAGVEPDVLAGHSLGEYGALVCSGALGFADALRLVRRRGELMQQAVPEGQGAMAAILRLDRPAVERLCRDAAEGQVLSPANYNAPQQTVVAGHAAAVERALELASQRGGMGVPLNVSAPFHCALMAPAAEGLAQELRRFTFSAPKAPVVNNVEARPYADPGEIASTLVRQVTSPVQWTDSVRQMRQMGVTHVVEVGAGTVLTDLVAKIDPGLRRINMGTHDEVFCCHRILNEARRQALLEAGWTARGPLLVSPDRKRVLTERGWFCDADEQSAEITETSAAASGPTP
jgi:[acyl-carrier-protein] S-malonyltransferase